MLNIVLFEPEIAPNTGNIGRTCVATNTRLHLIKPLGFDTDEKAIRRSAMDYWQHLDVREYENYQDFLEKNPDAVGNTFMGTTKAKQAYSDVQYTDDCYIMMGKESAGIPEEILVANEDKCVTLPMAGKVRSINLATATGILLYEAHKQLGFKAMEVSGKLHNLEWNSND